MRFEAINSDQIHMVHISRWGDPFWHTAENQKKQDAR